MPNRRHFLETFGLGTVTAAGGLLAAEASTQAAVQEAPQSAPAGKPEGHLRIALMQALPAANDQQANLHTAEAQCRQAAGSGADILLMPEMWNIGYHNPPATDAATIRMWASQAVGVDGPWVGHFKSLAKELGMAIAVTYLQEWTGEPRNALSLIDRHGKVVLTYGKVHTCDFAFEAALSPGDEWPVAQLDTAVGPVSTGSMICFDREFPESARSLMLGGAEVVLTPNGCLLDDLRLAQFQVRAYENAMVMAMANYADGLHNGRSVVYDAAGACVLKAGGAAGLYFADIDLRALRDYRARTLWGNAWRRPNRYAKLAEEVDVQSFRRTNVFGEPFNPGEQ